MEKRDIKIFAKTIEDSAIEQINALCNHGVSKGSKIRIMPDAHAGAGCVIGTTMTFTDRVCPNLVGVDIGCGMYVGLIQNYDGNLDKLDDVIRKHVPSGTSVHDKPVCEYDISLQYKEVDVDRAKRSIGTLGGGNHFIEVDEHDGNYYLIIHSGSRHLGLEVATYYQNLAKQRIKNKYDNVTKEAMNYLVNSNQHQRINKFFEVQKAYQKFDEDVNGGEMAYLTGSDMVDYLIDVGRVQEFAKKNRATIANIISRKTGITITHLFDTIHNYIFPITGYEFCLRKGSVSAQRGERFVVPMNMRDGVLFCTGKGNEDWNCSAPHGAGRLMSRKEAKESVSLDDFKDSMKDVYSTSVCEETLDESPFAYKSMDEIISCISDTCTVDFVARPVYNFKAKA